MDGKNDIILLVHVHDNAYFFPSAQLSNSLSAHHFYSRLLAVFVELIFSKYINYVHIFNRKKNKDNAE